MAVDYRAVQVAGLRSRISDIKIFSYSRISFWLYFKNSTWSKVKFMIRFFFPLILGIVLQECSATSHILIMLSFLTNKYSKYVCSGAELYFFFLLCKILKVHLLGIFQPGFSSCSRAKGKCVIKLHNLLQVISAEGKLFMNKMHVSPFLRIC